MTPRRSAVALGLLLACVLLPAAAAAQSEAPLRLRGPSGERSAVPLERHRGYAAVPFRALERIGWTVSTERAGGRAHLEGGEPSIELHPETPYFTWDDEVRQLAEPAYEFGDRLWVPLQVFASVLPRRLSDGYAWDGESGTLSVREAELWTTSGVMAGRAAPDDADGGAEPGAPARPPRVVVIDPGHGGRDIGTQGRPGVVEKDVALSVARELARELEGDPGLEVHLTRTEDVFVPLWERGERATRWKGDRPGVFVSIHANASPRSRTVRGFETYFLSEARTEHERRVAALENAPLQMEDGGRGEAFAENPDLDFILTDLRKLDHPRWSALLAEMVQRELAPVHPGPNRGVKQGPFAVITNALMPGVLVELGFLSNSTESRLLAQRDFHRDAARALAGAVRSFFDRYPPGPDEAVGDGG